MKRDYRDALIEELVDRELALRHQWRFERAMLLDRLDFVSRELAMLDGSFNPKDRTWTES